jgi:hypothetical protein
MSVPPPTATWAGAAAASRDGDPSLIGADRPAL